jgi:hypothetical protein
MKIKTLLDVTPCSSVDMYQTTRRYIPEGHNINFVHDNLKSYTVLTIS